MNYVTASDHRDFCEWHHDQYPWECTCGAIADPASKRPEWLRPITPPEPKVIHVSTPSGIDHGHSYRNGDGRRTGNWMQTYTGRQFWPLDPRPEEVFIADIAHALANACRFGGHCNSFYSVAEHSVLVSQVVPPELALIGLLHDASEAYVCDIPRPLKPYLTGYKEIEERVWHAIADRFEIPRWMPKEIKDADNAVLLAEAKAIMKPHPADWCVPGEPAPVSVLGFPPNFAEQIFLRRFQELYQPRHA